MSQLSPIPASDVAESVRMAETVWPELAESRLFITGGTGFIGRWLVSSILHANKTKRLGLRITVLTRAPNKFASEFPQWASDEALELITGDVRTFVFPTTKFTHVIHGATDTSADAASRPVELVDTIVGGTRHVLDLARESGARKFLLLSSGAIYGTQPADLLSLAETYSGAGDTTDVRSTYGQSKRVAEQLCTAFNTKHDLDTRIARCFSFVGPHMNFDGHFAIGNFIRDAANGGEIQIQGDGSPERSYLYGSDTSAWLLKILIEGKSGSVYNVGSDDAVTLVQLAERVAKHTSATKGVSILGSTDKSDPHSRYIPDISRARNELGLEVWTSLDESIRRTYQWLAQPKA